MLRNLKPGTTRDDLMDENNLLWKCLKHWEVATTEMEDVSATAPSQPSPQKVKKIWEATLPVLLNHSLVAFVRVDSQETAD